MPPAHCLLFIFCCDSEPPKTWASLTPESTTLEIVELSLSCSWRRKPASATITSTGEFFDPSDSMTTGLVYLTTVGAYTEMVIRTRPSELYRFHGVIVADQGGMRPKGGSGLQCSDLR